MSMGALNFVKHNTQPEDLIMTFDKGESTPLHLTLNLNMYMETKSHCRRIY